MCVDSNYSYVVAIETDEYPYFKLKCVDDRPDGYFSGCYYFKSFNHPAFDFSANIMYMLSTSVHADFTLSEVDHFLINYARPLYDAEERGDAIEAERIREQWSGK